MEQRYVDAGLDPTAAYDEHALLVPFKQHTNAWVRLAANALAHCVASGTAFLDLDAVVLDGSFCRPLLQSLIEHTALALKNYNWEGMWPATVIAGSTGPDARALGGAWLPLHANFAPHRDLFLKVSN